MLILRLDGLVTFIERWVKDARDSVDRLAGVRIFVRTVEGSDCLPDQRSTDERRSDDGG